MNGDERRAVFVSIGFLVVGIAVIWLVKEGIKVEGDAVFISLLLIPVVIYLAMSGKIEELKAPGGLEAKFRKTANETVAAVSETVEPSVEEMQIVAKEGVRALERKREQLNESQPIVMTMELGKSNYYRREDALRYIELLSQFPKFKFVIFVEVNDRFFAYMPAWTVRGLLSKPELGEEFIWAVNEGNKQALLRYPGMISKTISTGSTNVEALREMETLNLEALVVIDAERRLRGVVEREQVLSRMMLALAK